MEKDQAIRIASTILVIALVVYAIFSIMGVFGGEVKTLEKTTSTTTITMPPPRKSTGGGGGGYYTIIMNGTNKTNKT